MRGMQASNCRFSSF